MECIPELFQHMNVDTMRTQNNNMFMSVETIFNQQRVIMKLHSGDFYTDSITDAEDSMHQIINKKLTSEETPHLLIPIKTGSCDFNLIYNNIIPQSQKLIFLKNWILARGMYLFSSAPQNEQAIFTKQMKEYKDKKFEFLKHVYKTSKRASKSYDIHYIVTPYLPNLVEWVRTHNNLNVGFDYQIAFQVAQVLSVFANHGIMHNNLVPENVFILDEESTVTYFNPFKMTAIDLKQLVYIGNYEFSFKGEQESKNIQLDKLCPTFGKCNRYTPNLDWFCFLISFVVLLETKMSTQLRNWVGGKYGEYPLQNYKTFNNPCICTDSRCDTCEIDKDFLLDFFSTPDEFLEKQKESQDFIQYEGKPKRVQVLANFNDLTTKISNSFTEFFFPTAKEITPKEIPKKKKTKQNWVDPSLFGEPE